LSSWTGFRGRVDQLGARVREVGLRETVAIQRDVFRRIWKSTLAATLAWIVAEAIGSPRPALACLAAIIVVQITVRASLARSVQFTVAVTLGLGAALSVGALLGVHWWSVSLIVLASLVAGEVLRLGPLSGQVAISALLAMSLGNGYGIERVQDTAIGAVIGVLVNALIAPPSYVSEASRTLRGIGEDLGALLTDVGTGLGRSPSHETIRRWLTRARDLSGVSRGAIATVKQGEESLQFNPRARGEMAQLARLTEARRALDHAILQTRGVIRSLLDLPQPIKDDGVVKVMVALGDMLAAAGRSCAAWGRLQERPDATADRELLMSAHDAIGHDTAPVAVALHLLTESSDASQASVGRLLTSVLVDAERLVREVDIVDGEHRSAVTDSS